jgi:8-oxo-dGTP pyrophosphatase MutT (NUDIX family)
MLGMPSSENQKYTVGFVFDSSREHVLLVHKQKPDWQIGKLNGVGGKYEPGETPEACVRREAREETTLDIPESEWVYVGTIVQDIGNVGILAAAYSGERTDAKKGDYEEVEWFGVRDIPDNALSNVHWLVPLSLDRLNGKFKTFEINY